MLKAGPYRLEDGAFNDATITETAIVARDDIGIPDDAFVTIILGPPASSEDVLALNQACPHRSASLSA